MTTAQTKDVDVENDEHLRGATALVARGPHLVSGSKSNVVSSDSPTDVEYLDLRDFLVVTASIDDDEALALA